MSFQPSRHVAINGATGEGLVVFALDADNKLRLDAWPDVIETAGRIPVYNCEKGNSDYKYAHIVHLREAVRTDQDKALLTGALTFSLVTGLTVGCT